MIFFSDIHNTEIVIFNFSLFELTDDKRRHFSVKPGLTEYSELLLLFELLFCDIKREDLAHEDMPLVKARLLDTVLTSCKNFSSD